MNPVEILIAAAAYKYLRDNVGRCGRVPAAAAQVYWYSYSLDIVLARGNAVV